MELQLRREDVIQKAGKSHMSNGLHGGSKANLGSPSSRVSYMGEDRGVLKRMDVLEESIKLKRLRQLAGVGNKRTATRRH
jgi:hypothetical protein